MVFFLYKMLMYFYFSFLSRQSPQPGPSSRPDVDDITFRCRRCPERFANRRELYLHGMREHYQTGSGVLQSWHWERSQAPWEVDNDERLKECYEANALLILDNHQESSVTSTYNVPLTNDFQITVNGARRADLRQTGTRLPSELAPCRSRVSMTDWPTLTILS